MFIRIGDKILQSDRVLFIEPTKNKQKWRVHFDNSGLEVMWLDKKEFNQLEEELKKTIPNPLYTSAT